MKNRLLKFGIMISFLLIILLGLNVYLRNLTGPIVTKAYIEKPLATLENAINSIGVIRSVFDKSVFREVTYTEEISSQEHYIFEQKQPSNKLKKGLYRMNPLEFSFVSNQDGLLIEEIKIIDGDKVINQDIGSIYFYGDLYDESFVDYSSTSKSEDYAKGNKTYKVIEDVEIVKIESKVFPGDDICKIKVNGVDFKQVENMKLKTGETLNIEYEINTDNPETSEIEKIDIWALFTYKDSKDQENSTRIQLIAFNNNFDSDSISKLLAYKRDINK